MTGEAQPHQRRSMLSVIIPALDEERTLPFLLSDLGAIRVEHEVIVADGGSSDGTRDVARSRNAVVVTGERGRGAQLAAGAAASRGDVLCFLHADVRVDERAVTALERAARTPAGRTFVFRLRIDAEGTVYRLIELMANHARTRLMRLPYGDQGLIVSRQAYEAAGGYRALPLMEDVALVRALRRHSRLTILDASLLVSARRWQRDGPWRRTFANWALAIAFTFGVSAERLARWYR